MALTIPQGIYNIGAVQLNTQPLAALQGKLMAAEQERQAQLDKYFESQISSINSAGLRLQDQKATADDVQELKNFTIQNKKSLYKGDVNTKNQFEEKVRGIKNRISYAKSVPKLIYDLQKMKLDAQNSGKGGLSKDDDTMLNALDYPVNDPRHYKPDGTPYTIADVKGNIPAMSQNDIDNYLTDISRRYKMDYPKPVGKATYLSDGSKEQTYEYRYHPKNVQNMAEEAATAVLNDTKLNNYYETIMKNPTDPRFIKWNDAWVKSGFHPGDNMDDVRKLAMADIYSRFIPMFEIKTKTFSPAPKGEKPISSDLSPYDDIRKIWDKQRDVKFNGQTRKAIAVGDIPVDLIKSFGADPEYADDGITEIYLIDGENLRGFDNSLISREALALKKAPEKVREEYRKKQSGGSTPKGGKKTGAGGL
jgi:hypothetical protein